MNKFLLVVAGFVSLFAVSSCGTKVMKGEGNRTTASPAVSQFSAVDIDISLKTIINVQEGAQPKVSIEGFENLVQHIKATVENNTLHVYSDLDETWTMESEDVVIQITVPSIADLRLSGAPDVEMHGSITGPAFNLGVSGASDVKIDNVSVDKFSVEVSGAGDLDVKGGTVKSARYEINGAGEVTAYPLQTTETTASISGAGTCKITALAKLTVEINGAGTIKYKGHPAITQDISGAGTIADAN